MEWGGVVVRSAEAVCQQLEPPSIVGAALAAWRNLRFNRVVRLGTPALLTAERRKTTTCRRGRSIAETFSGEVAVEATMHTSSIRNFTAAPSLPIATAWACSYVPSPRASPTACRNNTHPQTFVRTGGSYRNESNPKAKASCPFGPSTTAATP